MARKLKIDDRANDAVLQTSRFFTPLWGDVQLTDEGEVLFDNLPKRLCGLRVTRTKKQQWLGGTVLVHFRLVRAVAAEETFSVRYRNARFISKEKGCQGKLLATMLNTEPSLLEELKNLDLSDLSFDVANKELVVTLTPYGGGLAFLAFPPVRYPIAFPSEQVPVTARVLENLERVATKADALWKESVECS